MNMKYDVLQWKDEEKKELSNDKKTQQKKRKKETKNVTEEMKISLRYKPKRKIDAEVSDNVYKDKSKTTTRISHSVNERENKIQRKHK